MNILQPRWHFFPTEETLVASLSEFLSQRQSMTQLLKENLQVAQARMKQQADKKRTERAFEVGDWVFLKLEPYRQTSLAIRKSLKLSAKYYGPFQVIARIELVAYKLQLPPTSTIHPVFHISLLKKKIGNDIVPLQDLPVQ